LPTLARIPDEKITKVDDLLLWVAVRPDPYAAGAVLRYAKLLQRAVSALGAARRALKFPRAASAKISLSSVRSKTARLSRHSPSPTAQPLQLISTHAAVLTALPAVRLPRHADLAHRLSKAHALNLKYFNLPQLHHNVFRLLPLPWHLLVLLSARQIYPGWWTTSVGALHPSRKLWDESVQGDGSFGRQAICATEAHPQHQFTVPFDDAASPRPLDT
jgi:hypothetical protein